MFSEMAGMHITNTAKSASAACACTAGSEEYIGVSRPPKVQSARLSASDMLMPMAHMRQPVLRARPSSPAPISWPIIGGATVAHIVCGSEAKEYSVLATL